MLFLKEIEKFVHLENFYFSFSSLNSIRFTPRKMERMTDGKPVPSNPISGAKLPKGEPSTHLYLLSRISK